MLIVGLLIVIAMIIVATTKFNLHPFFTLLLAAIVMGFLGGLDTDTIVTKLTEGFGNTLKSIGIVIACGTVIGVFLERSGGAHAMANAILKLTGEKKSPLAMSITGLIVSIPVFCDSGFVVLSSLNKAISRRTGISMAVLATALATGLYATHVFVPPTPGPLAAAATLNADIGSVLLLGLLVSIPCALAGLLWALYYARRFNITPIADEVVIDELVASQGDHTSPPPIGALPAFAPLIVPIILIALKSVADYPTNPIGEGAFKSILRFVGHPVIALIIGVFLAFPLKRNSKDDKSLLDWVSTGLTTAGAIILITGAGGAFGNVLRATDLGDTLGNTMAQWRMGIFLPFVMAAVLKTAQGSSTVAIISTAALTAPLLEPLGLDSDMARALTVLAIGAGAMTVSHVNDSYFWVVSQFSGMDTPTALRCHTLATLVQGVAAIIVIAILSMLLI